MEDASSQVELVLSSDTDEAAEGKGNRDHLHHDSNHKCYAFQKLGHTPKILCSVAAAVFLILIGFLIGYLVHQNKDFPSEVAVVAVNETGVASLDWEDVKKLLAQKLTPFSAETVLSEFTDDSHQAGSSGDEDLGNKVLKRFKEYGMNIWTENYFVKIQDPPVSGYNRIIFGGQEERTTGFLSYSASGTAKGAVLYANYGQEEDFRQLNTMKINMSGRVMLVRAGRISFAEKVANAAKMNASAVLIYPDPTDYSIGNNTSVFGHVHLGSGDPYTPGLPALNHTQFPPAQSSGLPNILAQTITTAVGIKILRQLGGVSTPSGWRAYSKLGDESNMITVEVNNVLTTKKIINVFGVIKGFVDADRYVVIGAQRDAWGPGFAASTVGTSVLVELARSISDMVKNGGFKPRRSIVFASWSAGEYGSVGATEWLEGYFSSLSIKAVAYINLDGIVTGRNGFKVAASPLLYSLIENALSEVMYNKGQSLSSWFGKNNWVANVMEPLRLDSAAYPFLAFSGIPSVAFRFHSDHTDYQYFGTMLDTRENLNQVTANQVPQLAVIAGQFAGHIALRLVHDHLLEMNPKKYDQVIRNHVVQINSLVKDVWRAQMQPQLLPKDLKVQWLIMASGSYSRACGDLAADIQNADLEDIETCRLINDRVMTVERNFLSPYVSPRDSPFRHILLGSGPHTLKALISHLQMLRVDDAGADAEVFRNQFALVTWTLQSCANSLAGDIWSLENEI